jgi:hypothetical protein
VKLNQILRSRVGAVALGTVVLATVGGAGASVAAAQINGSSIKNNTITSTKIKDGTIQKRDLTVKNFKKFTETTPYKTAMTPPNTTNPSYNGAPVVNVAPAADAAARTTLTTIALEKGVWELSATAQFWHLGGATPTGADLGVLSFSVAGTNALPTFFTGDIPDGGENAAQTSGTVIVDLPADTTVVVQGAIRSDVAGQAGASVVATQVGYKD